MLFISYLDDSKDGDENDLVIRNEVQNGDNHENGNELSNDILNAKADSDDEILLSEDEEEDDPDLVDINDDGSQAKSEVSLCSENKLRETDKGDLHDVKEEILIDDEDEVQDLSTKSNTSIEELVPKLSEELIGFPVFLKNIISLGDCIAISKKSKSDIDIDKDYSILDCPSQVVPLIIKKSNSFPAKLKQEKEDNPKQIPSAPNQNSNNKNMLTISDFYSSSVGKFLIGVGLSRVKQWYHKDAINKVRKQIRKEGEAEDLMEELKKQQDYLNTCRSANSSYLFSTEKCEHCEFRTEFKSILDQHMLYPHMTARKEFKCNYCQFSTRDSKVIIGHVNMLHEKKCLIELPPQLYECPICPYESGVKSKAATHIAKCLKFFIPEKLLINKDDYFPTITPKPITQEDIKIYEATLQALRFAALNPQNKVPQIPGLPTGLQQQMYSLPPQPRPGPGRPMKTSSNKIRQLSPFMMNQMNIKNMSPQLYQMLSNAPHGQFLPNSTPANLSLPQNAINFLNKHQMLKMPNSSSRNIQGNVANNANSNSKPVIISKPPNQPVNRTDGNSKGSFVMCEICDGYIKDLEQLRTHMHWIHKVKFKHFIFYSINSS